MTKTVLITRCAPALAHGIETASNCRLALARSIRPLISCADPVATELKVKKAPAVKAPKPAPAPKAVKPAKPAAAPKVATGIINSAGKVVLKTNKDVRTALTAAAKAKGGSRYAVEGFADSGAFLNGFPFVAGKGGSMVLKVQTLGANVTEPSTFALTINADGTFAVA